ncbi:hypothetical protein NR800_03785 [Corallococcus interemptor]|uniref:hypothetical protein n=1 Tax=Corallococcus TaxID=83461 RepID=UPI001CBD4FBC|nr:MULTISPECIES: hypothetical protein [unclassified Corallococcus]MBZ4334204.1 hypothetical protein [Corallococcus sp. AS-1-12]MBZ4374864.1 hypothetical protein [Corallococcus sp. AS-1-6]
MQAQCEQCGTSLPGLAPGHVLLTCRGCGVTYHVRDDGHFRRVGGPAAPQGQAPAKARGAVSVAPPNFLVEREDGALRIGWTAPTFDAMYLMLGLLLAAVLFAVRFHETVASFSALQWGAVGVVALAVLYPALAATLNLTWVEVRGDRMRIFSKPLPLSGAATVDVRTLDSLSVHAFTRKGGKGMLVLRRFALRARTRDGRTLTLVSGFESEGDVTWLANTLRRHLRLKDGPWGEAVPSDD